MLDNQYWWVWKSTIICDVRQKKLALSIANAIILAHLQLIANKKMDLAN